SFGDMLKVPAADGRTLSDLAGAGGAVHMVYAPFDALALAAEHPEMTYVVAAVGFETTAPAYALLIEEARARGLRNIRLLPALKSALAAIEHVCRIGEDVDAFLAPGHVSVITGTRPYEALAARYGKPMVIAGFEARQLLEAVNKAIGLCAAARGTQIKEGEGGDARALTVNLYPEAVTESGNSKALALLDTYFEKEDAVWRGLGVVPASGYRLRDAYREWLYENEAGIEAGGIAERGAGIEAGGIAERGAGIEAGGVTGNSAGIEEGAALPAGCRCGDVILGRIDPPDCPLFGKSCTPASAVGPCMVSSEGACGIWFKG
ncbi:MAG: hydrogenase formation protein HypD, partial [Clostridiales bacterium]|nr:hydrogenase formation protein HypD [Clostridiales bacterium]